MRRGRANNSVCLTYVIEKGEYSQAVGFVSGFSEALVLDRIVMDDMELKDKQTQSHRKEDEMWSENTDVAEPALKVGFCWTEVHVLRSVCLLTSAM